MKAIKKLLALTLAIIMIVSVSACHPKDEVAITVGDVEITSALYMYALLEADSAARSQIDEEASSSSSSSTTTTEEIDYYKEKIDGKSFTDWVKDTALERCIEIAYYEYICEEKGIELSEEELANVDYAVEYYWSYYGYSYIYEPNGVGKATFKRGIMNDYLKDAYFFYLYGEGGEKEVADSELTKKVTDTYLTAEVLQASITTSMEEEEVNNLKTRFKDYVKRLNKGEEFETIYNEYYEIEDDTTTSSNTSSSASSDTSSTATDSSETTSTEETEEVTNYKFPYATVMADEESETSYANALYAEVAKLKNDEVKYIEEEDKVTIVIRREFADDELRMEELKELTLWNEKSGEFEEAVAEACDKLEYEVNDFAVDRFKVKDIVYPTY